MLTRLLAAVCLSTSPAGTAYTASGSDNSKGPMAGHIGSCSIVLSLPRAHTRRRFVAHSSRVTHLPVRDSDEIPHLPVRDSDEIPHPVRSLVSPRLPP